MAFRRKKFTKEFVDINVHRINGDSVAIGFLKETDPNFAEQQFFFAKRTGFVQFSYHGRTYTLTRNSDLTYTICADGDEEEMFEAFDEV